MKKQLFGHEAWGLALYKSVIRDERLLRFINHSFHTPVQSRLITKTLSSRPVSEKRRRSKTNPFRSSAA